MRVDQLIPVSSWPMKRGREQSKQWIFLWICSKEGKDGSIGRKSYGHNFLWFKGDNSDWLFCKREILLQGSAIMNFWATSSGIEIWLRKKRYCTTVTHPHINSELSRQNCMNSSRNYHRIHHTRLICLRAIFSCFPTWKPDWGKNSSQMKGDHWGRSVLCRLTTRIFL